MSNSKEMMNKAYIDHKLASIFEPMVNQILQEQPGDTVRVWIRPLYLVTQTLIDWFYDKVSQGALWK